MLSSLFFISATDKTLTCNHIDEDTFYYVLDTARDYNAGGNVHASVVPHHLTAAPLIGGFFKAVSDAGADCETVILVGPNHTNGSGGVVVSKKDWDIFDGAECDEDIVNEILNIKLKYASVVSDDRRMADDHAVSSLIPFVEHYWPDAKVAPVLLSGTLDYGDKIKFSNSLNKIINDSGKRVLLICSVDFSHYLKPEESEIRDSETLRAIEKADLHAIHAFTDANADSSASLITFLNFSKSVGAEVNLLDRADASEFTEIHADGTTSYLIFTATTKQQETLK